jgi:membrane protease YdiL (CAAX protease family)
MKKCAYCGFENDDTTLNCGDCGTSLQQRDSKSTVPSTAQIENVVPNASPPNLGGNFMTYMKKLNPGFEAKQAWKCALVLIALSIATTALYTAIARLNSTAGRWFGSPAGATCRDLLQAILFIITVLWFARRSSVRIFLKDTGLSVRPTLVGWLAICASIGLRFVVRYGMRSHYVPPSPHFWALRQGGWFDFVILTVCIGPLYEEVTMRGFLYRAFRTTYGQVVSTIIVFCVDGYFHRNIIFGSLYFFTCHTVFQVAMCQLRERTKSLWNCLLPHATYNATGSVSWTVLVIGVLLLFPFCTRVEDDFVPSESGISNE